MKRQNFSANLQHRYSIRRFAVGTTSTIIGTLLFFGLSHQAFASESIVHHETHQSDRNLTYTNTIPIKQDERKDKIPITQMYNSKTTIEQPPDSNKTLSESQSHNQINPHLIHNDNLKLNQQRKTLINEQQPSTIKVKTLPHPNAKQLTQLPDYPTTLNPSETTTSQAINEDNKLPTLDENHYLEITHAYQPQTFNQQDAIEKAKILYGHEEKTLKSSQVNSNELTTAILNAETIHGLDSHNPIDNQLQQVLLEAKNLLKSKNITQQMIKQQLTQLNKAVSEKYREDAYVQLQLAITNGVKISSTNGYTPSSLKRVQDAIKELNPLFLASTSQDLNVRNRYSVLDIERATQRINSVIQSLELKADKSKLNTLISKAQSMSNIDIYSEQDFQFLDALQSAKALSDDDNATQFNVNQAAKTLTKAIDEKLRADAVKHLSTVINEVQFTSTEFSSKEAINDFKATIQQASEIIQNPKSTITSIQAITKAVLDKFHALTPNKAKLADKINEAKLLLSGKQFNEKNNELLKSILRIAETTFNNPKASVMDIQIATWDLEDEIGNKKNADAIDDLQDTFNQLNALKEERYTPNSLQAVKAEKARTQLILKDSSQVAFDEVTKQAEKMHHLLNALQLRVDKTDLINAILAAQALKINKDDLKNQNILKLINEADSIKEDPNASSQTVSDIIKQLNQAIVDKNNSGLLIQLNQTIEQAVKIKEEQYTPQTFSHLQAAIAQANAIKTNASHTKVQLDNSIKALQNALQQLRLKADYSQLSSEVQKIEAQYHLNSKVEQDKIVIDALTDAKQVLGDKNLAQSEVDNAVIKLKEAIKNKENQDLQAQLKAHFVQATSTLSDRLNEIAHMELTSYTPQSLTMLNMKVEKAKAMLAHATQKDTESIQTIITELEAAKGKLVKRANKVDLEKVIHQALTFKDLNQSDEEDQLVIQATKEATQVNLNQNATQEEVNQSLSRLSSAIQTKIQQDKLDAQKEDALYGLDQMIAIAKEVNRGLYTPTTIKNLENCYQRATAIKLNKKATGKMIEAESEALQYAITHLQLQADKSALTDLLNQVAKGTLNSHNLFDQRIQQAVTLAENLKENLDASQDEIDQVVTQLGQAIQDKNESIRVEQEKVNVFNSLKQTEVEISKLNALQYTPLSFEQVKSLEKTIDMMKANPGDYSIENISETSQQLKDAMKHLVLKADKSKLQSLIQQAEKLPGLDRNNKIDGYVLETLNTAKNIFDDANVTSQDVTKIENELTEQIKIKEAQILDERTRTNAINVIQTTLQSAKKIESSHYTKDSLQAFLKVTIMASTSNISKLSTNELLNLANALLEAKNKLTELPVNQARPVNVETQTKPLVPEAQAQPDIQNHTENEAVPLTNTWNMNNSAGYVDWLNVIPMTNTVTTSDATHIQKDSNIPQTVPPVNQVQADIHSHTENPIKSSENEAVSLNNTWNMTNSAGYVDWLNVITTTNTITATSASHAQKDSIKNPQAEISVNQGKLEDSVNPNKIAAQGQSESTVLPIQSVTVPLSNTWNMKNSKGYMDWLNVLPTKELPNTFTAPVNSNNQKNSHTNDQKEVRKDVSVLGMQWNSKLSLMYTSHESFNDNTTQNHKILLPTLHDDVTRLLMMY